MSTGVRAGRWFYALRRSSCCSEFLFIVLRRNNPRSKINPNRKLPMSCADSPRKVVSQCFRRWKPSRTRFVKNTQHQRAAGNRKTSTVSHFNVRSTFAGSLRWDMKAPGFEFSSVPAAMIYCVIHEMNLCHRKKDLKLDLRGKLRPQVGQLLTERLSVTRRNV